MLYPVGTQRWKIRFNVDSKTDKNIKNKVYTMALVNYQPAVSTAYKSGRKKHINTSGRRRMVVQTDFCDVMLACVQNLPVTMEWRTASFLACFLFFLQICLRIVRNECLLDTTWWQLVFNLRQYTPNLRCRQKKEMMPSCDIMANTEVSVVKKITKKKKKKKQNKSAVDDDK